MPIFPGTGWVPDLPDRRDHSVETPKVREMLEKSGMKMTHGFGLADSDLPKRVDLRASFAGVFNQGSVNSCTANALSALVMYFQKRAFDKVISPSRLFTYKVTRNLLVQTADAGAFNRTTCQSLAYFGSPPEQYWPYDPALVNVEPSAFAYSLSINFLGMAFYKYDVPSRKKAEVLRLLRTTLFNKLPAMFGFYVPTSISQSATTGKVPIPGPQDDFVGGHAVSAVGYDDEMEIRNNQTGHVSKGAVLFRNSWGKEWGEEGYGWLPYDYILKGLATDWWSLLSMNIVETGRFGFDKPDDPGSNLPDPKEAPKK